MGSVIAITAPAADRAAGPVGEQVVVELSAAVRASMSLAVLAAVVLQESIRAAPTATHNAPVKVSSEKTPFVFFTLSCQHKIKYEGSRPLPVSK